MVGGCKLGCMGVSWGGWVKNINKNIVLFVS